MRVGIFETTHFEGAYPVIKCFDNGANEITIFCYEESYRQFQHLFEGQMEKFSWVVKSQQDSKYKFIYRIYKETKSRKLDLLYLNTISDNFIFYAWILRFLKGVRVVLTIHSINNFFWKLPSLNLRAVIRSVGKKQLIKQVNEFNVVAMTLVDYLRTKLAASKIIYTVPGAVYEQRKRELKPSENKKISRIVVPGVIDARRRNYQDVLQLAELINKTGMRISITLLGGLNKEFGSSIIESIKNSPDTADLKYYTAPVVDQPEFDREMDDADIVLLPATVQTYILDGIYEEYGVTQSTGTLFDIVKHAKPFIAPRNLRVDPFLEKSCLRYDSVDEILEIIQALEESPDVWQDLQQKAKIASTHYTIEAVRKRNPGLFENA